MPGIQPMIFKTQDPKYDISVTVNTDGQVTDAFLINSKSGIGIAVDEPLFILRAKDKHAVGTLHLYLTKINVPEHIEAVKKRS